MTDAGFAEEVLRQLEKLDKACLDFIDADSANPRDDAALQVVRQRFRDVNAYKTELLNHDLLRLDALAREILQSPPGEWSSRLREELTGGQAANVAELHCHVRRRHPSLLNLARLLRGRANAGPLGSVQGEGEQAPTGAAGLEGLSPAVQLAWSQYQGAINARQDLAELGTDREVYDFARRTLAGESDGVRLPAFDTWQRYLRSARRALDCRKHEPRYGRPHGSSIVHQNQI